MATNKKDLQNLIFRISLAKCISAKTSFCKSSQIITLVVLNYGNNPPPVNATILLVSKKSIGPIPPLNYFYLIIFKSIRL